MTLPELLTQLAALPGETLVPVHWVREQLAGAVPDPAEREGGDLAAAELAARWRRGASTIRAMCDAGELPGAYKFRGREWRIPMCTVEQYEAGEREKAATGPAGTPRRQRRPAMAPHGGLRALARGSAG